MKQITHRKLVENATLWLRLVKSCNPVFAEKGSANISEMPDALGWTAKDCLVIECKTSVSDFRADKKKEHRINKQGLGNYRYFLMPSNVYIEVCNEIPEKWGHLIFRDERQYPYQERFKGSKLHTRNLLNELYYLRSRILEIQRYGQ